MPQGVQGVSPVQYHKSLADDMMVIDAELLTLENERMTLMRALMTNPGSDDALHALKSNYRARHNLMRRKEEAARTFSQSRYEQQLQSRNDTVEAMKLHLAGAAAGMGSNPGEVAMFSPELMQTFEVKDMHVVDSTHLFL